MKQQGFEGAGLGADIDVDDAFGLGADIGLGAAAKKAAANGKGIPVLWGAVTGAGLSTVGALSFKHLGKTGGFMNKHAEWLGLAAGAVPSAAMIAMGKKGKTTAAAGWAGLAAAFLSTGLRAAEKMMFEDAALQPTTDGMYGPVIEPTTAFLNGSMGMTQIEPTTAFLGDARRTSGGMPQLVGATIADASQHVQLVGGPALAMHANHWGATHFQR